MRRDAERATRTEPLFAREPTDANMGAVDMTMTLDGPQETATVGSGPHRRSNRALPWLPAVLGALVLAACSSPAVSNRQPAMDGTGGAESPAPGSGATLASGGQGGGAAPASGGHPSAPGGATGGGSTIGDANATGSGGGPPNGAGNIGGVSVGSGTSGGSPGSSAGGSSGGSSGGTFTGPPLGGASGAVGSGVAGRGGSGPAGTVIDSVAVPASGATVTSKVALDTGALFLLEATGTTDGGGGTSTMDAEFGGISSGQAGADLVAGTDVGVDTGFKVERVTNGAPAGRKKWFGAYRADHTYYMVVTGAGAPMSLKMILPGGTSASGNITVSVLRLSPAPPVLAAALESLQCPVTKQTVTSQMTTTSSVVYLLQASGSGKVGGANLGLGDADWMDWNADGVGKEDIGDQNIDYGLGVDESNPAVTPRQHWWGPWRKDHIYYLLFAGTGNPISFTYYDAGYGDNSTTDKLTVQIFAVP